ncbi:MAG: hypothetical protein EB068_05225 [Betaproteobacteria bacterium]|nr:hypothetical protein [Betaproteobacteria bacterium]
MKRGIPIVGLEPSCLLSLRDEFQAMRLGQDAVSLAATGKTFEEFLVAEAQAGRFQPVFREAKQPILVHGHCHQKAFDVVNPMLTLLKMIPGAQTNLIETSCCGMAGSFGYEAEHHEASMQMAELALLPALRKAPDAIVVADGSSCRHQMRDGARREALHLARVLDIHL